MKAISIHAPWAWAIINGHKRFENRVWKTNHRGPIAIHASASTASDRIAIETIRCAGIEPPTIEQLNEIRGKVIGTATIDDVVELCNAADEIKNDPFVLGPICFVIGDPVKWKQPHHAKGKLRLWNYQPSP